MRLIGLVVILLVAGLSEAGEVSNAVASRYDSICLIRGPGMEGSGSYLGDRLVLSAHHVTSGGVTQVVFPDGERHTGRVVKSDARLDLSLIELTRFPAPRGMPVAGEQTLANGIGVIGGWSTNKAGYRPGTVARWANREGDPDAKMWVQVNAAKYGPGN